LPCAASRSMSLIPLAPFFAGLKMTSKSCGGSRPRLQLLPQARRLPPQRSKPSAHNRMEIGRVIGAADEWTRGDVCESFFARNLAIELELLRRDVFQHRQMIRRRTQILAHRQNLTADLAQIVHRLKDFGFGFAEAKHDAAFGHSF